MGVRNEIKRNRRREAFRRRMSRVQDPQVLIDQSRRWYILVIEPRGDREVRRGLEALGLGVFMPGYSESRMRRRKLVTARYLYLTRYCVFGVQPGREDFASIEAINGVAYVLRDMGGAPRRIADPSELQTIADKLTGNSEGRADIAAAKLMLGATMRVTDGPFTSFSGVVEEILAGGRARIAVDIFGRVTPIELDADQVEMAEAA